MITYEQQLDFAKVFAESLFYGADCMLMAAVAHIQLTSRRLQPSHKALLVITDVTFLLTTLHMCLLLYESFTNTVPPRVLQAAVSTAQIQLFLGDLVLVWRVWVVWNRNLRVIVIPVLFMLSGFVVGMIYAADAVSYSALSKILPMPTSILTVVNTTLCTALIAGRLAYLDHLINGHLRFGFGRDHTYRGVILMIVESGAVLTLATIISLVLERLHHPGLHVMLNINVPLANIVPTTIIVLSHLKLAPGDTANETATVRFATQIGDSAFVATAHAGTHSTAPGCHECEMSGTRSGTSFGLSGDIEDLKGQIRVIESARTRTSMTRSVGTDDK